METRASYLIVGLFVIAGMVGLIFAAMWITGTRTDESLALYDIYFDGAVSGLKPGNAVQYRGIPVGGVIDMRIDPDNLERVLVTIEVRADTPVRVDTEATLALQGITGLSYIQLTGGTQAAADLKAVSGQRRAVIKSRPSELAAIFEAAPELLNRAIEVMALMEKLLGPENQERIGSILQNIENTTGALANSTGDIDKLLSEGAGAVEDVRKLTSVLAENTDDIDILLAEGAGAMKDVHELTTALAGSSGDLKQLITDGSSTMANVRELTGGLAGSTDDIAKMLDEGARTMEELRKVTSRANTMLANIEGDVGAVAKDTRAVLGGVKQAVASLAVASDEFAKIMTENSDSISNFSQTGLYEFSQLMSEARVLVASLGRLVEDIERDPARFLFGDKQQGVEVQ
ncbi:MAG: MCE family protein [Alphaproteobacteria bacterium]|nr:MCE family protein [Alphaproteobacteria bacterium]